MVIGIDPGRNGGIGLIHENGKAEVYPYSDVILLTIASMYQKGKAFAFVEKVNAMPGQGVKSMFTFGQEYGYILGVLEAQNIPFQLIPPQTWKREFSLDKDKKKSIAACRRLFPGVDLRKSERARNDHDGLAEALLIAEWGRRHCTQYIRSD